LNTKEDILKNVGSKIVDHDVHDMYFPTLQVNGYRLVTNILQNSLFCVLQKKDKKKMQIWNIFG